MGNDNSQHIKDVVDDYRKKLSENHKSPNNQDKLLKEFINQQKLEEEEKLKPKKIEIKTHEIEKMPNKFNLHFSRVKNSEKEKKDDVIRIKSPENAIEKLPEIMKTINGINQQKEKSKPTNEQKRKDQDLLNKKKEKRTTIKEKKPLNRSENQVIADVFLENQINEILLTQRCIRRWLSIYFFSSTIRENAGKDFRIVDPNEEEDSLDFISDEELTGEYDSEEEYDEEEGFDITDDESEDEYDREEELTDDSLLLEDSYLSPNEFERINEIQIQKERFGKVLPREDPKLIPKTEVTVEPKEINFQNSREKGFKEKKQKEAKKRTCIIIT